MVGLSQGGTLDKALRYYTPEMGGAIGDGDPANAAADRAGWEWLEANAPAGATIHAYGQYCIGGTTTLELTKAWSVDFGTSGGFINCRSTPGVAVQWSGTLGTEVTIASDVAKGATSVDLSDASGVAVGDIIRLASDIVLTDSRPAVVYEREWSRVLSVVGNTVGLAFATEHAYAVADDSKAIPATPIRGLRLRGPNIVNDDQAGQIGLLVQYFDDLKIEGATATGGEKGIYARFGIGGIMSDVYGKGVNKGLGYAFQFQSIRFGLFLRPGGEDCRHIVETSENSIHTTVTDPQMGVNGAAGVVSWHAGPLYCNLIGGSVGGDVYMRGSINTIRGLTVEAGATVYVGEVEANAPATKMIAAVDGEVTGCTFRGAGGSLGKVVLRHPPRNFNVHHNTVDIGAENDFVNCGAAGYGLVVEHNSIKSCRKILTLRIADWSGIGVAPFGDANFAKIKSRWNRGTAIQHIDAPASSLLNSGLLCDGLELRGNELTLSNRPICLNANPVWIKNLKVFDNETLYSGSGTSPNRYIDDQIGTNIDALADWSGMEFRGNRGVTEDNMSFTVSGGAGVCRYTSPIGSRTTDASNAPRVVAQPPSGYSATIGSVAVTNGLVTGVNFTIRDGSGTLATDGQTVRFVRVAN